MRFDRKKFFDGLKGGLLRQLNQRQVDGLEFLLGEIERTGWAERSIPEVAYALATVGHETAWTFQPINEYRAKPGTAGRKNQDRYWLTGYYGRGYVQLTWRANYEKAGKALGVDLANRPELALEPEIAFRIMYYGMRSGWFTGKRLSDYIRPSSVDYVNARRVINGTDRADMIAGYARVFERVLRNSATAAIANATDAEIASAVDELQAAGPEAKPFSDPQEALPQERKTEAAETHQPPALQTPAEVEVEAPPPTGMMAKLKAHLAAMFAFIGGGAGLKEYLGVQLSEQTVTLLKYIVPTVLVLGFIGLIVWYVSEKVIGWKTLRLQAEIATDPERPNLKIRPQ